MVADGNITLNGAIKAQAEKNPQAVEIVAQGNFYNKTAPSQPTVRLLKRGGDADSQEPAIQVADGSAWKVYANTPDEDELGNLDSKRDWGYAKDYVECMWLILQQEKPDDFVIATGVQHTVREFTTLAFQANGIILRWEGEGLEEKGIDTETGKVLVRVNPAWYRPTDVDNLWGDPTKARTVLGWNPQKTSYEELCFLMARYDRELAKREKEKGWIG